MSAKPQQIFEYLLAAKNMTSPPIRNLRDYEFHRYANDFPVGEGCYLFGAGEDEEAWVEVYKQTIQSVPKPDKSLVKWIKTDYTDASIEPQVIEEIRTPVLITDVGQESEKVEKFNQDRTRVKMYNSWLEVWKEWAADTKHKRQVQELYEYLFSLSQRFEREGETLDLCFGHGILTWNTAQGKVVHPIFITRLELSFNTRRGIFSVKPSSRGTVLELEMLTGVEIPNVQHLHSLKTAVADNPFDVQVPHFDFYNEFVQTLSPNGYVDQQVTEIQISDKPSIIEKPVLLLRRKSGQLWKEELQKIIEAIEDGFEVPKAIESLLEMDLPKESEIEKQQWAHFGEELLFPLPANEDQKEIARRLAGNFGVVVQGPPGTGKSHTIANLVSHLLAHGKKVLVTSHTERALRVLTEKIPKDIRSVCVSVLGADIQSLQDIENSIDAISDQVASLNVEQVSKQIASDNEELSKTKKKIADLQLKLRNWAEKEYEEIDFHGEKQTPIVAAKWISDNQVYNWLPDQLAIHEPLTFTEKEFQIFWSLRDALNSSDYQVLSKRLPQTNDLLSPPEFDRLIDSEQETIKTLSGLNTDNIPKHIDQMSLNEVEEYLGNIDQQKHIFGLPHTAQILEDMIAGGERKLTWEDIISYCNEACTEISKKQRLLSEYAFNITQFDMDQIQTDVKLLEEKFKNGKSPGLFFNLTSGKKLKYLLKEPVFNNKPVKNQADLEILIKHLELHQRKEALVRKWNATIRDVDGPTVDINENRLAATVERLVQEVKIMLDLLQSITYVQKFMSKHNIVLRGGWASISTYEELKKILSTHKFVVKKQQIEQSLNAKVSLIREVRQSNTNYPLIWDSFEDALINRSKQKYETVFREIQRLTEQKQNYDQFLSLLQKLVPVAPKWAKRIEHSIGKGLPFPSDWVSAWKWSQLQNWIEQIGENQPDKIEAAIVNEQQHERKLIEKIVANSTWKYLVERMTDRQKRALLAWKQKIKRIGKGTGKYADQFRKEARQEMDQCRSAIPVWIMPIHRVLENFTLTDDKFDVVIVDESSQCDIFSLSVLTRATKAVIVGDDEQISPYAVGIDQESVRMLMERHLQGVPQANSLDMQTSLYDIAVRVFPGKLMLKEHFRCVPEIIQFSNDLSYAGEIIPLRIPNQKQRIEPAIVAKRVAGFRNEGSKAYNEVEAEAIVADIEELIQDPKFSSQTMGVISLQGDDQAKFIENLLRKEIGEEEMINRKIICGDAYAFQGDERDIIFLSMMIAPNVRFAALAKKDAQQRYNVAASRARNQMRLYHSVDLSDLSASDMRQRLLQYCINPTRVIEAVADLESQCESPFEIDALKMILAKGYNVRPQVVAGRYRIDFVIEGLNSRLAVECDGERWHGIDKWEEDRNRQRDLERVGWNFWRVRGSDFYRDRKKAMDSLWSTLESMGIESNSTLGASHVFI